MVCKKEDWNYVTQDSNWWRTCEITKNTLGLHKLWERLDLENSFASWSLESNFGVYSSLIAFHLVTLDESVVTVIPMSL